MVDDEVQESEGDIKNDEWFKDHYIDLMQRYPREWIAVKDQQIIATGPTKNEVVLKADEVAGDEEYSLYFVLPTSTATDTGYSYR